MDLNMAISDLYKKRSSAVKRQPLPQKSEKKPRIDENLQPMITFEQLFGCDEARNRILKRLKRFERHLDGSATKPSMPVLVRGSQGLGKTSLVEAAAQRSQLKLVTVPLKSLARRSREEFKVILNHLVKLSITNQPSIVLVDDLDKLSEKEDMRLSVEETIDQLISSEDKVLVFCTSSKPLTNEANFSMTIELKRPNQEARYKILESFLQKVATEISDDDLRELAFDTPSFSPFDLFRMVDCAQDESEGCAVKYEHFSKAISFVKSSFTANGKYLIAERPTVSWDDIGGLPEVRKKFLEIIDRIRKDGISCKFAGFMLYGPPGCGKTMVAKAMANEAGLNFISIKPGELLNKYHGETEHNIIRVFREAREYEPCMIYFDEFEGLCGSRENRNQITSAINTFLAEMDGFRERGDSIVLASTNRIQDIDNAMKRPGRLSEHIYVGPPNKIGRVDILKVLTKTLTLANDVCLDSWAARTDGFTGADLGYMVQTAKWEASRESSGRAIHNTHLDAALKQIRKGNKDIGRGNGHDVR